VVADDGAVVVGTRDVFSEQELARLRGFPEITRAELIRYFALASSDEGFLRKFTGRRNVLGAGVQLCSLPWLGFVPDEVGAAPERAVARLADRLGISAGELAGYGERAQTRTDHLQEIVRYLGWRPAGMPEWKELDEFLFARAMELPRPRPALCRSPARRVGVCLVGHPKLGALSNTLNELVELLDASP
jgi:hypothetical protein